MILQTSFKIAVRALGKNKLRTSLAMLGMTIGVAAVLTMFALGTGAQESVSSEVRSAGTTLIFVRAGNYTAGGEGTNIANGMGASTSLSPDDESAIHQIDGVAYASSVVRMRGWVEAEGQKNYGQIYGVDTEYPKLYDWSFQKGRFFKDGDVRDGSNVVILGSDLRDTLFGDENPVGKEVQIHGQTFTVKGVFTTNDEDQAQMAFVPYTTLQKLMNVSYLNMVTVSAEQAGDSSRIAKGITTLLRGRHHLDRKPTYAAANPMLLGNQAPGAGTGAGTPDDFTVKTQAAEALTKGLNTSVAAFILANMPQVDQVNLQEMSGTLNRAQQTMTALLAAIATISLIVGGIGIMNIMLVSVTERTREIGIRRAVGARSRDVLMQFLVEALTLGVAGGILGILVGFLASLAITYLLQWPASASLAAIALSFGVSALTGIFFGFYPARRASMLNPIDALRFE